MSRYLRRSVAVATVLVATFACSAVAQPEAAEPAVSDTTSDQLFLTFAGELKYFAEKVAFAGELSEYSDVDDRGRHETYEFPLVQRERFEFYVRASGFTPSLAVTSPSGQTQDFTAEGSSVRFWSRSTEAGLWTFAVVGPHDAAGEFEVTVRRIAPARPTVRVIGGFCQTLELALAETIVDNAFLRGESRGDGTFATLHGLHGELESWISERGTFESLVYRGAGGDAANRVFGQTVTAIGGCLGRSWTYVKDEWEDRPNGRARFARFVNAETSRIGIVAQVVRDGMDDEVRVTVLRDPAIAESMLEEVDEN